MWPYTITFNIYWTTDEILYTERLEWNLEFNTNDEAYEYLKEQERLWKLEPVHCNIVPIKYS